jgi:hypothetical protein
MNRTRSQLINRINIYCMFVMNILFFSFIDYYGIEKEKDHVISMCAMLSTHGNVDTWIGFTELAKGSGPSDRKIKILTDIPMTNALTNRGMIVKIASLPLFYDRPSRDRPSPAITGMFGEFSC